MRKYLIELLGTFVLVLTVGLTGNPIAIGAILTVLVYIGYNISGAHYNPAITAAVFIRKRIQFRDASIYILFQLGGAFLAALVYKILSGSTFTLSPGNNIPALTAFFVEVLFTFVLGFVILIVATHKKLEGNSFYGLAIGLTIIGLAFAGGKISGGAFNPAVGLGPIFFDTFTGGESIKNAWLYLTGPTMGGIFAGLFFNYINNEG